MADTETTSPLPEPAKPLEGWLDDLSQAKELIAKYGPLIKWANEHREAINSLMGDLKILSSRLTVLVSSLPELE